MNLDPIKSQYWYYEFELTFLIIYLKNLCLYKNKSKYKHQELAFIIIKSFNHDKVYVSYQSEYKYYDYELAFSMIDLKNLDNLYVYYLQKRTHKKYQHYELVI